MSGPELALAHRDRDRAPHRRVRARGAEIPAWGACPDERAHARRRRSQGQARPLRVDLNVPMENGARHRRDPHRARRCRPSRRSPTRAARSSCLSHFDRPKGSATPEQSLKPIAAAAVGVSGGRWASPTDCIGERRRSRGRALKDGDILLLENTRFHTGEEKNDPAFAEGAGEARRHLRQRRLLGRAPRACLDRGAGASLPAYAGRAMQAELDALAKGARATGAPGRRDRRRRQGLDQDRSARRTSSRRSTRW